jgi:hypothetical protein
MMLNADKIIMAFQLHKTRWLDGHDWSAGKGITVVHMETVSRS